VRASLGPRIKSREAHRLISDLCGDSFPFGSAGKALKAMEGDDEAL
jgi:hypothetical protein